MAIVHDRQRFTVYRYKNGDHEKESSSVAVNTTLPELAAIIEKWRDMKEVCCWEACNSRGNIVAWRGCNA